MAWQGVPFLIQHDKLQESVNVALNSIPKIVIESPADHTSAWITAGVSLAAGIIPAAIAIWTFKRNAANIKTEREKQQFFLREERSNQHEFLREERRNQQAFLESDRIKQQESLEQDRETQIKVAERNFNMQVLSGNRQRWIDNLRDVVAEYTVNAPSLIEATNNFRLKSAYQKDISELYANNPTNENVKDKYSQATQEVDLAAREMHERNDKVVLLSSKILMMLNPKEVEYKKISELFNRVRVINAELISSVAGDELFSRLFAESVSLMKKLIEISQLIFKTEWERVKKGI